MTAMTDTSAGAPGDSGSGGAGADESRKLTRTEASDAVSDLGWRYILGWLRASVPAASLAEAAGLATRATAAAGPDADATLWLDVRHDGVVLALQDRAIAEVTAREARLAGQITAALRDAGYATEPGTGGTGPRSLQMLEIAIDAMDISSIRPFWRAVLGYVSEPGAGRPRGRAGRPGRAGARRSGSSRWTRRARSATGSISTCPCRTTRPSRASTAALAAGGRLLADDEAPRRSGCWPTPRATRPASRPGRAATRSPDLYCAEDAWPTVRSWRPVRA